MKILLATGILLAICASASYLLLHEKSLVQIEKSIADRLGFLEEPCC